MTNTLLYRAAQDAGLAPSILNTQPWRWTLSGDVLELFAEPGRRLPSLDPDGRLMVLSCGAALHHATVALAAAGREPAVDRLPDPARPELLARIRDRRARPATRASLLMYRSIRLRRTDRRCFARGVPVPPAAVARLRLAAGREHARLHLFERDDIAYLRYAAQGARTIGAHDPHMAAELRQWTDRAPDTADGVPPGTVAAATSSARPVPLRDFGLGPAAVLEAGPGDDDCAEYAAIATDADETADWLTAGAATSAVWLAATALGLAMSPMSEVVEIPGARALVRGLLRPFGQPQLVLRFGVAEGAEPAPASPRRVLSDVAAAE